jgi:hypothetical protein
MDESSNITFDPDGECGLYCISMIECFLRNKTTYTQNFSRLRYLRDFIQVLDKEKYGFMVFIPLISILSPYIFYLKIKYGKKITISRQHFLKMTCNLEKYCILYHLSSYQLYGIKDNWSHWVCELFDKGKRIYKDDLRNTLISDGDITASQQERTHNELLTAIGPKIFIWNNL